MLMLCATGRSGLSNSSAIHKLRGLMLQCLYVLMTANHSGQTYFVLSAKYFHCCELCVVYILLAGYVEIKRSVGDELVYRKITKKLYVRSA